MSRDPLHRTINTYRQRLMTGWQGFDDTVALRPEILVNLFGTPGVGKSFFALSVAKRVTDPTINRKPVGVLYITLDTPLSTQAQRWWAMHQGLPVDETARAPRLYQGKTLKQRKDHGWIEWLDQPVTVYDLPDVMKGVKEYTGSYPGLVIVDVVKDMLEDASYEEFSTAFKTLKEVSMGAKTTVLALHHATKSNDPTKPLALRAVEYAGDKQPDVVLGMYLGKQERAVAVSVLKNRSGLASPTGSLKYWFRPAWDQGGAFERANSRGTTWALR